MSLFESPEGSVIGHACNAQGVWGSGIAKEFKLRFPEVFKKYNEYCKNDSKVGTTLIIEDLNYKIVNMITSENYGNLVDKPETILENTKKCLNELKHYVKEHNIKTVYSNKFNSGLFKVPWEKTEQLILQFTKDTNCNWIVCVKD